MTASNELGVRLWRGTLAVTPGDLFPAFFCGLRLRSSYLNGIRRCLHLRLLGIPQWKAVQVKVRSETQPIRDQEIAEWVLFGPSDVGPP